MLAIKRSPGVAPEVDIRECTLHSPLQKANMTEPTLALKSRGDVTKNPKQGYQWPQNRTCVCGRQKLEKQSKAKTFARLGNLNLSIKFTVRVPGDGERGGDSSGPASAAGVQPYPGGSRGHVGYRK